MDGRIYQQKKNGEEFIENSIISPIFDKNQKITNFIAIKEDITARKIAEQKLVESEEKYRSLINGLGEMMYRLSLPNGKYEYVSPSVMQIYGYSQKDFIENPLLIMSIIHPDYAKYFYDNWMDLLQDMLHHCMNTKSLIDLEMKNGYSNRIKRSSMKKEN